MKIKEGYLYHIKDDFFELMKDNCLLQNAFPILEKYVSHVHTANEIPTKVKSALNKEIFINFKRRRNKFIFYWYR